MLLKIGFVQWRGFSKSDLAESWLVFSHLFMVCIIQNNKALSGSPDSDIDIFIFMAGPGFVLPRSSMTISSHETRCLRLNFGDFALWHHSWIFNEQAIKKLLKGRRVTALWTINPLRPPSTPNDILLLLKIIFQARQYFLIQVDRQESLFKSDQIYSPFQFIGVILMTNSAHKLQERDIIIMFLLIIAISLPFHHIYSFITIFQLHFLSNATQFGALDLLLLSF